MIIIAIILELNFALLLIANVNKSLSPNLLLNVMLLISELQIIGVISTVIISEPNFAHLLFVNVRKILHHQLHLICVKIIQKILQKIINMYAVLMNAENVVEKDVLNDQEEKITVAFILLLKMVEIVTKMSLHVVSGKKMKRCLN